MRIIYAGTAFFLHDPDNRTVLFLVNFLRKMLISIILIWIFDIVDDVVVTVLALLNKLKDLLLSIVSNVSLRLWFA